MPFSVIDSSGRLKTVGATGSVGPTGNNGATGPAGPIGLGLDGFDGNDGIFVGGIGSNFPELLASVVYNPGSLTTVSTSSTTPADIDTVNLIITFVVPSSGRVLVSLSAIADMSAGTTGYCWSLRDTGGTTITGSRCQILSGVTTQLIRSCQRVIIIGLTPGTITTWRWAHFITATVATGNIRYGDAGGNNPRGPAVMEVWSA